MKRFAAFAAIALAGCALWWALRSGGEEPPSTDARQVRSAAPQSAATPDATSSEPPTLRGTSPSGGLAVDGAGHFVPDRDAVLFFEYFLSASRDEPVDALIARIRAAIRERLAPPADAEALAFFDQYLAYLESSEAEFDASLSTSGVDLERRLQWVREHRRAHFGADLAETLFGDEQQATEVYAAMRRVRADPALGDAERAKHLRALEDELPAAVREARDRAAGPLRLAREEQRLRELGASAAEIQRVRVERFGPEAAERLRRRDLERSEWDARWSRYRDERAELLARERDAARRDLGLAELRRTHFAPEELGRVEKLDRAEAGAASSRRDYLVRDPEERPPPSPSTRPTP